MITNNERSFFLVFKNKYLFSKIFKYIHKENKLLKYHRYSFYDFPIVSVIKTDNLVLFNEKLDLFDNKRRVKPNPRSHQEYLSQIETNLFKYHIDFENEWFIQFLGWKLIGFSIFKRVYKTWRKEILNQPQLVHMEYLNKLVENKSLSTHLMYQWFVMKLSAKSTYRYIGNEKNGYGNNIKNKWIINSNCENHFNKVMDLILTKKLISTLSLETYKYLISTLNQGYLLAVNTNLKDQNLVSLLLASMQDGSVNTNKELFGYFLDTLLVNPTNISFNLIEYCLYQTNQNIVKLVLSKFHKLPFKHEKNFNAPYEWLTVYGYEISKNYLVYAEFNLNKLKYSDLTEESVMEIYDIQFNKQYPLTFKRNKLGGLIVYKFQILHINTPEQLNYIIGKIDPTIQSDLFNKKIIFQSTCFNPFTEQSSSTPYQLINNQFIFSNFMLDSFYNFQILNENISYFKLYYKKFPTEFEKLMEFVSMGYESCIRYIIKKKTDSILKLLSLNKLIDLLVISLPSDSSPIGQEYLFNLLLPILNSIIFSRGNNQPIKYLYDKIKIESYPINFETRKSFIKSVSKILNFQSLKPIRFEQYSFQEGVYGQPTINWSSLSLNLSDFNLAQFLNFNQDSSIFNNLLTASILSQSFKIVKKFNNRIGINFTSLFQFLIDRNKIKMLLFFIKKCNFFQCNSNQDIDKLLKLALLSRDTINNNNLLDLLFGINHFKNIKYFNLITNQKTKIKTTTEKSEKINNLLKSNNYYLKSEIQGNNGSNRGNNSKKFIEFDNINLKGEKLLILFKILSISQLSVNQTRYLIVSSNLSQLYTQSSQLVSMDCRNFAFTSSFLKKYKSEFDLSDRNQILNLKLFGFTKINNNNYEDKDLIDTTNTKLKF